MDGLLKFVPLYQERVWGGDGLARHLGRQLPGGQPIGESWEVVDRPEAQSLVAEGPEPGLSLRDLIASNPTGIMGEGWPADKPFPILVKWLDCQQRLSLQVHPPADIAPDLGGEPKTENWFVAHASPDAALLAGLQPGVTREQFAEALKDERAEPLVRRMPVKDGCSLFVPSGRIHAIDAGNLILEIQQNSDTTYRVYDWGRVGLDGKPRTLHLEQSLASIDFADTEPQLLEPSEGSRTLAESDVFRLRQVVLDEGESVAFPIGEPQLGGVVWGRLSATSGQSVHLGDNFLVPANSAQTLTAAERSVLLVTDRFTG
ncbi:MAG: type I phosphomannose isomerase catalytic subunit [Opitutales bacterium]